MALGRNEHETMELEGDDWNDYFKDDPEVERLVGTDPLAEELNIWS